MKRVAAISLFELSWFINQALSGKISSKLLVEALDRPGRFNHFVLGNRSLLLWWIRGYNSYQVVYLLTPVGGESTAEKYTQTIANSTQNANTRRPLNKFVCQNGYEHETQGINAYWSVSYDLLNRKSFIKLFSPLSQYPLACFRTLLSFLLIFETSMS